MANNSAMGKVIHITRVSQGRHISELCDNSLSRKTIQRIEHGKSDTTPVK